MKRLLKSNFEETTQPKFCQSYKKYRRGWESKKKLFHKQWKSKDTNI